MRINIEHMFVTIAADDRIIYINPAHVIAIELTHHQDHETNNVVQKLTFHCIDGKLIETSGNEESMNEILTEIWRTMAHKPLPLI